MRRGDETRGIRGRVGAVRSRLLSRIEESLELPMVFLGFAWLLLLITELIYGLPLFLEFLSTVIWIVFLLDFALRLSLASHKITYITRNWLTVIALIVPAIRVFRVFRAIRLFRAARAVRGLRLVRLITSVNRGMKVLGNVMGRHGFGYVVLVTVMVIFSGAAGMNAFENHQGERGLNDYWSALWWTAMLITTMGSEYWPTTTEGRILCFLLALYAFTIFGYVTATLATFLLGREAKVTREGQLPKNTEQELQKLITRVEKVENQVSAIPR